VLCKVWKILFFCRNRRFSTWKTLWKKRDFYQTLSTHSIESTLCTFYPHSISTICGKVLSKKESNLQPLKNVRFRINQLILFLISSSVDAKEASDEIISSTLLQALIAVV